MKHDGCEQDRSISYPNSKRRKVHFLYRKAGRGEISLRHREKINVV